MQDEILNLKQEIRILKQDLAMLQDIIDKYSRAENEIYKTISNINELEINFRKAQSTIDNLQNKMNTDTPNIWNEILKMETKLQGVSVDFTLFQKDVMTKYKLVNNRVSQMKKDVDYQDFKYLPQDYYEAALIDWYYEKTGKQLNLRNPHSFNEKIQWLKMYDSVPAKTALADKYLAKEIVANIIGKEYVIPLLGVWNNFNEIDFENLPRQFVLKANHGSGWNIVVKDKNSLNYKDAEKKFNGWMNKNFAFQYGFELHYMNIEHRIIAEPYIGEIDGDIFDYRFFCFNGIPTYIWVDSGSGTPNHKRNIYDINWNLQNYKVNYPHIDIMPPRPKKLNEMIILAQKLSKDFSFVRVDFYYVNDIIYFGEMTFTPQSGVGIWEDQNQDLHYGELLNLPPKSPIPQRISY